MPYRVLGGNRLFRCHEKETKSRERRRETKKHNRSIRHKEEEKNDVQCMNML